MGCADAERDKTHEAQGGTAFFRTLYLCLALFVSLRFVLFRIRFVGKAILKYDWQQIKPGRNL